MTEAKTNAAIRLSNLDYLRGFAALGIMLYHYLTWITNANFSSDAFFGRVGVYGVSIFYVLSGLTLFYVYYDKLSFNSTDILSFFRKRFFRIFPLLWLVTLIRVGIDAFKGLEIPGWYDLFLNVTGLFGLLKWDASIATGAWSIGNELVFYLFFPFFVFFTKSHKKLMLVTSAILLLVYLYFAFIRLDSAVDIVDQKKDYVNPLNQVFLFLSGFLIGIFFRKKNFRNATSILLIGLGLALFIFYPVAGNTIHLITGLNRLVFTLCCLLVCIGFFKLSLKVPAFIHKPLSLLGEASYSVYLVHPIMYAAFSLLNRYLQLPPVPFLTLAIAASLLGSYVIYSYFEKPLMKLGRKPASTQRNDKEKRKFLWMS